MRLRNAETSDTKSEECLLGVRTPQQDLDRHAACPVAMQLMSGPLGM
jgi:hypothetical protein